MKLKEIKTHLLDINIPTKIEVSMESVVKIYEDMLRIHFMEQWCSKYYKEGEIRGFCHLVLGQEGIYAALKCILGPEDRVIGSYRCHGLAYATGSSIYQIMAEMFGRKTGMCKGKGGSMHLYNEKFYGGHGIVGAQVPIGVGIGLALKGTGSASFVFYGDGASNQGQVHESFNMAALWKLPVIFICENNQYGMWTPVDASCIDDNFYTRGPTIPGIRVSHSDVFQLVEAMRLAKDYAINNGPIILQIDTYRSCGHSMVDKEEYRGEYERREEETKNPMHKLKEICKTKVDEDKIAEEVKQIVLKALSDEQPESNELFKDILV
ncbi:Pyruvate dehydrogenase E1 component subunit alpha, mitochondrial [Astathelohania contejeani]|uniref:Pyruvate dehydrogenase E1 component subunit alpha, mitochondrial n=1 Tax=Astathelohania contejeani TaxID=164912 RepID=A0ABQ7HX32_9MICR|nr:Pyruvate dehydrogenase E1 component subunit alpha, mitochondrial [Thelohania contejeani]